MSDPAPRGWVGFADGTELWWLRFLKPGFRHCFAVLAENDHWLVIDPLSPLTEVRAFHRNTVPDLPAWFATRGFTMVEAPVRRGLRRPAPWRPFTCVEAVKRVLGLRAPAVFTPWQLYRRLERERRGFSLHPEGIPMAKLFSLPSPLAVGEAATTATTSPATTTAATNTATPAATTLTATSASATTPTTTTVDATPVSTPADTAETTTAAGNTSDTSAAGSGTTAVSTTVPTSTTTRTASDTSVTDRSKGMEGTIATSLRGVLLPSSAAVRKRLLGE